MSTNCSKSFPFVLLLSFPLVRCCLTSLFATRSLIESNKIEKNYLFDVTNCDDWIHGRYTHAYKLKKKEYQQYINYTTSLNNSIA